MRIHLSFPEKALARGRVMHKVRANNFDGNFAVKGRALAGKIDFTHSANIDTTDQVIVPETELALPF
jgi:hypothetical protein